MTEIVEEFEEYEEFEEEEEIVDEVSRHPLTGLYTLIVNCKIALLSFLYLICLVSRLNMNKT